ncbi:hypothetical protein [Mesobacillus maritimus]|uniref:Uncharacterized protein n=1 Tax=Mesobacillus maritimus TaxID=1643336 RepID=A0ABS7K6U6_9BACI|nr:hypothetical protein [Mesobacillus maritimus]MBY0097999.1 hypothetical protein [Mesobacillus maritimus]
MILPNGVTGFYDSESKKPPQVNGKLFKQLCFEFASWNGGKVIDFNEPKYPRNFYFAKFEIHNNQFFVLLNEHYPYLAYASVVEFGNITFIDKPVSHENFSDFYKVLGKVDLEAPINQNLVVNSELNRAELEQLAYWKPETVGQIIFNYWD